MLSRQGSCGRCVLYIGHWDAGQNIKKSIDMKPQCVLYIGPAKSADYRDFPTEQPLLYIGPVMPLPQFAPTPFLVIASHVGGMLGTITAQIVFMLSQPALGIAITSFEVIRILFAPAITEILKAPGTAGLGTSLLGLCGAGVRDKPGSASAQLLLFHGSPSSRWARGGTTYLYKCRVKRLKLLAMGWGSETGGNWRFF